jgi:DNA ligase D-like protein (predicted 3'-phosphoesterase)
MFDESMSEISTSFCVDIVKKHGRKKQERPVYVIQEHHATRLHWDLRLEFDGLLKSWALPKIPPQKEGERRLAVSVPDHPIEYAMFEGEIPKGSYGAGSVKIWDKGTFETIEHDKKKLVVHIKGQKLQGKYCLLHFKPEEKNWLFFKIR